MAPHNPPRIFRRVPFETAVRLRFDNFSGFVTEYSGNISLGGMFIRSDSPPPMGTQVEIEFKLDDDFDLIRGRGKVIWVRDEAGTPALERGLGVRFVELTPGSRELIFQVVDRYVRQGGTPFDLDEEAARAGGQAVGRATAGAGSGRWPIPVSAAASAVAEEPAPPKVALQPPEEREPAAEQEPALTAPVETSRPGPARDVLAPLDLGPPLPTLDDALGAPPDSEVARSEGGSPAPPPVAHSPVVAGRPAPTSVVDRVQGHGTSIRRRIPRTAVLAAAVVLVVAAGAGIYALRDRLADWVAWRGEHAEPVAPAAGSPATAPAPGAASASSASLAVAAGEETPAAVPETGSAAKAIPADAADAADTADPAHAAGAAEDPAHASDAAADRSGRPDGVAATPARRILKITWSQQGDATDLVLWADGAVDPAAVRHARIGGPLPREVLRIIGIAEPFSPGDLAVGSAQLRRVRSGVHREMTPPELHVVLDLAGSRVAITSLDAGGAQVRVRLEGR